MVDYLCMRINKTSLIKMDLLILAVLEKKDCYGYEIAATINSLCEGTIKLMEGNLYPILHRLLENGCISSYEISVNRKIRVYYHLEETGKKVFSDLKRDYYLKIKCINALLGEVDNEC